LCRASGFVPVPVNANGGLRERQLADLDRYSVPALTHYEDRNSMANGLEVRHPFLDHRVVNYLTSLPTNYKIRDGWTKYILRKSSLNLPKAIRWRKDKQGFITEEAKWIRGELQPEIRRIFKDSRLQMMGILDGRKFLAYYEKFLSGRSEFALDICRAYIAEVWMRNVLNAGSAVVGPARVADPIPVVEVARS